MQLVECRVVPVFHCSMIVDYVRSHIISAFLLIKTYIHSVHILWLLPRRSALISVNSYTPSTRCGTANSSTTCACAIIILKYYVTGSSDYQVTYFAVEL